LEVPRDQPLQQGQSLPGGEFLMMHFILLRLLQTSIDDCARYSKPETPGCGDIPIVMSITAKPCPRPRGTVVATAMLTSYCRSMPRPSSAFSSRLANDPLVQPLAANDGTPLAVQAYTAIREILFRGVFQQGEALRMEELCERLGTSKQPIADALKRLDHEGYLTIVPQVGCHVRRYTYDEVRDYYRLYGAAEGLLAELAARRITPGQIAMLEAVSVEIGMLVAAPSPRLPEALRYRQLNRQFHSLVRDAASSWLAAQGAAAMFDRSDFFTVTMRHSVRADRLRRAHAEHGELLSALRHRNEKTARTAMEQHVLAVGARLWEPEKTSG
jgi:DNA-binding GntR family transcriptional regulator